MSKQLLGKRQRRVDGVAGEITNGSNEMRSYVLRGVEFKNCITRATLLDHPDTHLGSLEKVSLFIFIIYNYK